jgi:hypothetical protein
MIKAFAISVLLAVMGSSISEFTLSPGESFTLHVENDYVFTLSECGTDCISLRVSQMTDGTPTWTGQLFDLEEHKSYPLQMNFADVVFDSLYVVSAGEAATFRVSYREPKPVQETNRLVKATSEKETTGNISILIILELCTVIFLVFLVARKMLHENPDVERSPDIPGPAVGFHDSWQEGIPRYSQEDPDLELLHHIKKLETLREVEMQHRMRRRLDEEETLGLDWI